MPGRKVEVEAYGWAFAAGKPLYFLFQKGRKTVASVKRRPPERGPAATASRGSASRAKLKAGAYRLVLSTERRTPSGLYTWRKGRVVKGPRPPPRPRAAPMRARPARRGPQPRSPHGGGGRGPS